ncbi:MAG: CoA transferase [Dehalococcoidia bacterium]|nr:CoA transferase [Dehalococcoidia bacterium]
MAGPCNGLTVLDFGWGMSGVLATAVLGDFGAEVINVEPPTGNPFRSHPTRLAWNRGKKSIILDLETPEGRERAEALALSADVVLESSRPGATQRLGIDYQTLSRNNPRLVYCSITGFGQKGRLKHLKDYEGVIAAKTGRMSVFAGQTLREGPTYVAVQTASWAASQAAVRGILAALRIREKTGRGQWVQTSLMQGMIPYDFGGLINGFFHRKDSERFPADPLAALLRVPTLEYIPVRTKDGRWLQHANVMARLQHAHLRAIGLGWVYEDERFKTLPNLTEENREVLREMILERMQEKTLDEWMDIYVKDGDIAAEPYLYTVEGMQHEQFGHNRHVVEINDPRVGPMKIVGLLADLADTPGKVGGPAPDLGQHTEQVLAGMAERAPVPAVGDGNGGGDDRAPLHPLEDITMLDFSTVLAGPYGASMIADLGARVIKVDATPEREQLRMGAAGTNFTNLRTYNGKECIQVDLQTKEGQELIHKLIAKADVLLHNFRPGAPDRLGIDYETCRRINPRLIHVYVGAYGATGPHNRRPGAHPLPGALFGGALRQAGRAMPPPAHQPMTMDEIKDVSRRMMRANEGNPDPNTSQGVGTAIMLGLWDRERTGQGQAIQVTMMCANAWANHDEAYDFADRPPYAIPDADCYGLHALYRLYEAKEGWVFLACLFEEEWAKFCRAVGRTDLLSDPRFALAARSAHDVELTEVISQLFAGRTATEWEELLTPENVACVRVADTEREEFFLDDPHAADNELAVEVEEESPRYGRYVRPGGIVHFSEMLGRFRAAPYVGQHTRDVLQELGYGDEQIDEYRERRIVAWEEPNPLFAS